MNIFTFEVELEQFDDSRPSRYNAEVQLAGITIFETEVSWYNADENSQGEQEAKEQAMIEFAVNLKSVMKFCKGYSK